ncbi:ShlB/FhaC/HecB family hemolysin secretion/activation protein [Comamonas sp. lk]|uniref:ShlB/FhaC/HecB family hemolysin secretion/activation protein n=1 Tax=Comamonas sp. lk TaxID=2201272 RepID=UPI0013CE688D|nr:ShlB/FhaC/HecB family hemolysin secretion/activation protein [Comamonas sp. lk]
MTFRRTPAWTWIALANLLAGTSSVLAQQIPDAGSALRQTEQERRPILPPAAPPSSPPSPEEVAQRVPATGPTLKLSAFRFEGNTLLSNEVLTDTIAAYLQRPVRLLELETAAALLAQRYREEGWLARVLIPPQEVEKGVFTFKVIEAAYGGATFSADTDSASLPVGENAIISRVEARQARGDKLHLPSLERGLLIANDLPGLQVAGSQVAGRSEGETEVVLKATATRRLTGELAVDNYGSRSTGEERMLGRLSLNGALGWGEQFDLATQFTRHLSYGRIAAALPLGSDGLRLAVNASALHYKVGTPEFSALAPRGSSRSAGMELLYPLVRARSHNLFLSAGYDHKRPYNTTVLGVSSDYTIGNKLLRLDGNMFDSLGAGAVSSASLSWVFGRLNLDGSPTQALDAATVNSQGSFKVLRYRFSRDQQLGAGWSLFGAYSGQMANKNLDSAEKLYLGGPNGVRAYPLNEGGGSEGRLFNLELRWRLPPSGVWNTNLAGFYDWGRVDINRNRNFAGAPALNSYSLSGYGLTLTSMGPEGVQLTATLARRAGNNPYQTVTGHDQDGSLRKYRIWLALSKSF